MLYFKHTETNARNKQTVYTKQQLYLHKAGDAYKVSEWHYLSLQRTHGNDVLALLIKHNTVDACIDNTHTDYLHCPAEYALIQRIPRKEEKRAEQNMT